MTRTELFFVRVFGWLLFIAFIASFVALGQWSARRLHCHGRYGDGGYRVTAEGVIVCTAVVDRGPHE